MLSELTVENLGVIKRAHLEFSPGMVAISGESGAGKSMLLGGLKLILGGRADVGLIRDGATRATVDGMWTITDEWIRDHFDAQDVELEDNCLWINRIMGAPGEKSRFVLAGRPSPTSSMDDLKNYLVEIHGQSDQIKLRDPLHQRGVLDTFAGIGLRGKLSEYKKAFTEWRELSLKVKDFEENFSRRAMELRFSQELVERYRELAPEENELESIQIEIDKLSHLEEISERLGSIAGLAFPEDGASPFEPFEDTVTQLRRISQHDPELEKLVDTISDALDPLHGAMDELESYITSVDLNDLSRLKTLEDRQVDLKIFAKPYGGDLNNAISASLKAESLVEESSDELDVDELKIELAAKKEKVVELAASVSEIRKQAALKLAKLVNIELKGLAMGDTALVVEVKPGKYSSHGADDVSFMVETKGNSRRSIVKAASGGELSRLMLALEVVTAAEDRSITFVFDEIDTGVGGSTAMEIGRRLAKLAKKHQVIVVTHLPQVAAWADTQLVISKDTSGEISSDVRRVEGEARVQEIARMLSGLDESETGLAHAGELLALTEKEKQF